MGDIVTVLPNCRPNGCKAFFHRGGDGAHECEGILKWLTGQSNCPLVRLDSIYRLASSTSFSCCTCANLLTSLTSILFVLQCRNEMPTTGGWKCLLCDGDQPKAISSCRRCGVSMKAGRCFNEVHVHMLRYNLFLIGF